MTSRSTTRPLRTPTLPAFTGNMVSANSIGALVSNDQLGFDTGSVSASFTSNAFTGGEIGLYVEELQDSATPGATTTVNATSNTITGATTAGVQMIGGSV